MTFFARPDLGNTQFKQLTGTTLTLSGVTQINKNNGLQLYDGSAYVPIMVTGGTNFDVLTYCNGIISLQAATASGGTGTYQGSSPTTCTVGGLSADTAIYGCSVDYILQNIVAPLKNPIITSPSISNFSIVDNYCSPSASSYEVGTELFITGTTCYSRGAVDPVYCGGASFATGLPYEYSYTLFGVGVDCSCSVLTATQKFGDPTAYTAHTIQAGSNSMSVCVKYLSGDTIYNSSGGSYCTYDSGCTSTCTQNISGIYPYFYGTSAGGGCAAGVNRPSGTTSLITGGTKVVGLSNNTVCINFGSTSDDYIWFATPTASTTKTCWFITELNKGSIGGGVSAGCNLFPDHDSIGGVGTVLWSGQTYKLYISNYQTEVSSVMELRNS